MKKILTNFTGVFSQSKLMALLIGLVLVLMLGSFMWSPSEQAQTLPTPTPGLTPGAATEPPYPIEYLTNAEQTTGIVLIGALLMIIVVGGTFYGIRRKPENR